MFDILGIMLRATLTLNELIRRPPNCLSELRESFHNLFTVSILLTQRRVDTTANSRQLVDVFIFTYSGVKKSSKTWPVVCRHCVGLM